MTDLINIGMIGVGNIGLLHLLSLKKIIEDKLLAKYGVNIIIRTIADIDEVIVNKLKAKNPYNIEYFTTNPDDVINDKSIDIIYITAPTKFHKDYYMKAAEEGKIVFCEKPIAFTLEDIQDMISQEAKQGIRTHVGLVLRHCPFFWKLKQILLDNKEAFGKRLSFIFRDTQEWPVGTRIHSSDWRKNPSLAHGGCLYEHSIHDVDILEYLFAENYKISRLFSKIRYVSSLTVDKLEDVATIKFEYEDGFVGDLISIWNKAKMDERRIEIFFENGYVLLDGYTTISFNKFEYLIGRKKKKLKVEEINEEYQKIHEYPSFFPITGHYIFENLNFLKSVIQKEKLYPGLKIGYRAHEIIEAAYQSSRENRVVSFV